ncbi:MAG: ROK family protein [Planctomycetota bacterium]|jgi:glucokinase|nr:ROK family protein [Planctomycetota bacterium]
MAKNASANQLYGGIDVGGTKVLALLVDRNGSVVSASKRKTRGELGFRSVCERAAEAMREAAEIEGYQLENLAAIGIAVPCPVLPTGCTAPAPNLPGWKNAPLIRTMEELTGRPVYAENDGNAGVYGEYAFGAGKNAKTLLGLFVGTGIGGGLVYHGELVVGENRMAAEVGHIIVQEGGRRCGCGHKGCLEAYASKTGMARRFSWEIIQEGRKSAITQVCPDGNYATVKSSFLREAYRSGDPVVVETLQEGALYLGVGVASFITLFGPDMIVIGGGVFEALGKELLPSVKESARQRTWPEASYRDSKINLALLGDHAVGLGAAAFAMHSLDRDTRKSKSKSKAGK